MGEAKRRGSLEDRIKQSQERQAREEQERMEKRAEAERKAEEWWASLTPEQQADEAYKLRKRRRAMALISMFSGIGQRYM